MDNIKEIEIIFTYIDEESKEHTVKLNNFVNVKDVDFSITKNQSNEYTYKNGYYELINQNMGDININLSLKCEEFESNV